MTNILPDQVPPARKPPLDKLPGIGQFRNVRLSCLPPLGQATIVSAEQSSVDITVCLATHGSDTPLISPPQVAVWHNHNGEHEWTALECTVATPDDSSLLFGTKQTTDSAVWYSASLTGLPKHGHAVSFTFRFRASEADDWTWVKDAYGLQDGILCYQTQDLRKHSTHAITDFFSGFSDDIKVQSERAQTSNTQLYSLSADVVASKGDDSGYTHHKLGVAKRTVKWFAEVRIWSPWLAPRHGGKKVKLDKDAILISFLREDGLHVTALAISGVKDVLTTFVSDDDGNVLIKARNERPETGRAIVLVAVAESFDVANAAVFYHARKVVAEDGIATADVAIETTPDEEVQPQWHEEWFDGFTYCTWNALGQDLSAQKIYDALDDLAKENINITNLIIDDNWQSLTGEQGVDGQSDRGWTRFEANDRGFPDGMKATTAKIRKDHPNIKHIAVWHAILGYWGGVSPDGWIAENYKTVTVAKDDGLITVVAAEDVGRMYDDFYKFLADSGVDSVKTDAQFMLDWIHNAPDRRALVTAYQDAWTIAHLRHLSARAISCMSQVPQLIFHSQLPTNKPRLLVRNSDDFFPEVDASHPWHVFCNAHNSLVSQHLNVLPDWDMFQTSHKWASFHAAARCVSGGPIYFTDYPGHHNIKLIRQITAQTMTNATIILRPDRVGKTMTPYNDYNSQAVLRVGTYVGRAQTGTGILGVFNVAKRELSEFLRLSDFPGTENGEYVVHSFVSGEVSKPATRDDKHKFGIHLATIGWDVLSAHPLRNLKTKSGDVQVALFGLLGKMTGAAAITNSVFNVEDNMRLRIRSSYKAVGVVGVYISTLPQKTIAGDLMVTLFGKPIAEHCVSIDDVCKELLVIDVERAWADANKPPQWSNEIQIEVFVQ